MNKTTTRLLPYILAGISIGVFFPTLGTVISFLDSGQAFTWPAVFALHRTQPLFWIIDCAPLVLALFSAAVGNRTLRYLETSLRLDEFMDGLDQQIQNEGLFFKSLIAGSPMAIVQLDVNLQRHRPQPGFRRAFRLRLR